eukprot:COSAG01_NODE_34432_length_547_cov_12.533482_1_plen_50_part_10
MRRSFAPVVMIELALCQCCQSHRNIAIHKLRLWQEAEQGVNLDQQCLYTN